MSSARRSPVERPTRTVLVVDDDPTDRRLVELALRQEGSLEPLAVGSIDEARAALAHRPLAAVLLDVHLHDGDSLELLSNMTAAGIGPVVMLTGADSLELALQAMRAGAVDVVVKAAGFAELVVPAMTRAVAAAEMQRASREQRARIDALTALNELKNDFIARISHELRTPLTYVLGYAELLHTRSFDSAVVHEMAGDILTEARRLTELVDTLLAMAERERSGYEPERVRIGLATAIRQAWDRVPGRDGHELACRVPEAQTVAADPRLLRQALTALLENAVRYGRGCGEVRVQSASLGDGIRLSVTDDGMGFDPALAERLFEPLYRVEGDHTHQVRGLGLGLTTARGIVEAHGGWVVAHSDGPGNGARFEVWLPNERTTPSL
ncbi:MAG TPA: ATP-binding protein [Chloroflexota bacterium]|nr:ATP-binding protein [Chloroflexota bacterium]